MADGDIQLQQDEANIVRVPHAPPRGLDASKLKRATEYLYEADKIRPHRAKSPKYRRYVELYKNDIYTELTGMYRDSFSVTWPDFRHLTHAFPPPGGLNAQTYFARCYISGWFRDLYHYIRKSLKSLSGMSELEYYGDPMPKMSFEYDNYLALLGSSIRPTHIVGNSEDVMYVPLLGTQVNVHDANPFHIADFVEDPNLFAAIVSTMKDRKKFNMVPTPTNFLGRPCWLFDWHPESQICAPFHPEGNFNNEDIAIAFILGTACTPLIGVRDRDDWQLFQDAVVPAHFNFLTENRALRRSMWGSYEVRTCEIDEENFVPTTPAAANTMITRGQRADAGKKKKSKKAATESTSDSPSQRAIDDGRPPEFVSAPRYRLTDWCYPFRVIMGASSQDKFAAHRIIAFN